MVVRKKTTPELKSERIPIDELQDVKRTPISVIADNIRSLDNVGLLFRLCDLARVEKLYLTGYTGYPKQTEDSRPKTIKERHSRRIEKTAVYAVPVQPWEYTLDAISLVKSLKEAGQTIIALEQTDKSVPYHKLAPSNYLLPLTIVLGHERHGVRQELLELADHVIDIPVLGSGNSHNVATACGIVLYHILEKTGRI
ncbi:MAG: TrmH family RNA methyltransferase [Candidatus Andersenbacteria bacterium]|nr:TrmH family RNA methyltransferase [Candidatus Andersenbacteria bacterium]MBI3250644.1 TrmH family RNA methyltransferase [Candidatus Andersenbacteria bacterium]